MASNVNKKKKVDSKQNHKGGHQRRGKEVDVKVSLTDEVGRIGFSSKPKSRSGEGEEREWERENTGDEKISFSYLLDVGPSNVANLVSRKIQWAWYTSDYAFFLIKVVARSLNLGPPISQPTPFTTELGLSHASMLYAGKKSISDMQTLWGA